MSNVAGAAKEAVALAGGVSREYLLHHRVCPTQITDEGALVVAVAPDALVPEALDDLGLAYRRPIVVETTPREEVERLIARLTSGTEPALTVAHPGEDDEALVADVRDVANSAPVAAYVNFLVGEAVRAGASDVHLEAVRGGLVVRFRLDGILLPAPAAPGGLEAAILSRLKLMADLDIAERRRPQDGRIRVRLSDRELDVRVSTVPTLHGESVVLRVLDRGGRPVCLDALGMPPAILEQIRILAKKPHGIVLVTGPTGSGKTTTLYAVLGLREAHAEKIITIEDPIEYQLPGITQVPVHAQTGLTFAAALRSILRQDPDVIMIGEMRDSETASLAVQAAMTGHLVFSTLHTNDALGAIPRLIDLGVPPYLVAATVDAVLAQRLVRRVCPDCAELLYPSTYANRDEIPAAVRSRPLAHGTGCSSCRHTGYAGRIGIFELVRVSDAMQAVIGRGAARAELRELAEDAGWHPLWQDAWVKVTAAEATRTATSRRGVARCSHERDDSIRVPRSAR
ncbi:MAG TPA: GspE/PulE family protein [Gemmatimonadaceae bacterium]|nr:GspE/PulE family protein [Gemmatimonadaceae bacterium]